MTNYYLGKKMMKYIGALDKSDVGVGKAVVDTSGKRKKVYFSKTGLKWAKKVDTNIKTWTPHDEYEYGTGEDRRGRKHGDKTHWTSAKSIRPLTKRRKT
jgi:hypothetical protein